MRPWSIGDRVRYHNEDAVGVVIATEPMLFVESGSDRIHVEYEDGERWWFLDADLALAKPIEVT
jgi:hypothetical protein